MCSGIPRDWNVCDWFYLLFDEAGIGTQKVYEEKHVCLYLCNIMEPSHCWSDSICLTDPHDYQTGLSKLSLV